MTTAEQTTSVRHGSSRAHSYRARMLTVTLVGVGMLIALVFPFPVGGRLWSALFDLAHAPAFCLLLLAVVGFIDPPAIGLPQRLVTLRSVRSGEIMVLAGGCLFLGCVGEFLQAFAGRSPGVGDLLANAAGVVTAVLWIRSHHTSGSRRTLMIAAAALVLLSATYRPMQEIWGALQQRSDFPLLASFERSSDLQAWVEADSVMERTSEWASEGEYSLRVDLFPGQFSGVNMIWPVQDWRGYDQLHVDFRNLGQSPMPLVLKIHDRQHVHGGFVPADRFESEIVIPPDGVHVLSVDLSDVAIAPETRAMNMSQISGVEFFAADLRKSATVFLDNMRLVSTRGDHSGL